MLTLIPLPPPAPRRRSPTPAPPRPPLTRRAERGGAERLPSRFHAREVSTLSREGRGGSTGSRAHLEALLAELIVDLALVGIRQHVVRLAHVAEVLLRLPACTQPRRCASVTRAPSRAAGRGPAAGEENLLLVVWVAVRVQLQRELAVRLLERCFIRVPFHLASRRSTSGQVGAASLVLEKRRCQE